jgi:molybdate transport system ATP-binding protein
VFSVRVKRLLGTFQLDVDFEIERRAGVIVLGGVSGSGKSSVLRCIAGLERPDSGRIAIDGRVLFDGEAGVDVPVHQRRVGVVFQDSRLFPHLSVKANLLYGQPGDRDALVDFDELVGLLGVGNLLDRRPAALSGGERQRVAIGRALLSSPALLLMDEPLANLDDARKSELLPFLATLPLRFAVPIVYVTHSLDELLQMADELVVLKDGRVVAHGAVTDTLPALRGDGLPDTVLEGHLVHHADHTSVRLAPGLDVEVLGMSSLDDGARVRLRIAADDVTLAVGEVPAMSVRNHVSARVEDVASVGRGRLVRLTLRDAPSLSLYARVSSSAETELAIVPGLEVTALIKASSIRAPGLLGA